MAEQPNLVFFMSDSHHQNALGCYGHPVACTPHLDRLAGRGARFTTAYCATPLCCPSRAAIATGRFPHQTGYWDNVLAYDGRFPSWMKRLRDQGANVVSIGKLHYRAEDDDAGFSRQILPMHILDGVGGLVGLLRWSDEEPRRTGHFEMYVDESGPGRSSYIDYDRSITAHTIEWLREHGAAREPWALFVSYACPHPPFQVEQRLFDLYDAAAIPLPPQWRSEDRPQHPAIDALREKMGFGAIDDEATLRRVLHAYLASISHLDEQIGLVLEALAAQGLTGRTRIVYTSDHGEAVGHHGLVGKCTLYETSMAVPLIMAGPGIPEGRVVDQPASHVDLFPTILESFGVPPAAEDGDLLGQSIWPALEGKRWRRRIFGEYHGTGSRVAGYMLRDGADKLIYHAGFPPQLFDLAADPDETNDLAATEPARIAPLEAALRAILDPEATDARAKADQQAMAERVGGNDAIRRRGAFPFTPPPGTDPRMVEVRWGADMHRILVALCEQEISSFNPVPTAYESFQVHQGDALIDAHRGADTCLRGALDVFEARSDIQVSPVFGAKAPSGGTLCGDGFRRIADGFLAALRERADGADALYFSLHGAMGAEGELDPEGYLLEEARRVLGPRVPIVISLDLHGILTARMLRHCNGITVYWTYPHQDFVDTGERAARLLLRILDDGVRPVMARVKVPALVRGPELITATGCYGSIIRAAQRLEREEGALAAAMMIGNPFTDVPELCSQSLVITDGDEQAARNDALALARDFWAQRARMQASLVSLKNAIRDAKERKGPVTFTDAADAISSGASGDSNAILKGLLEHRYAGRAVMPVVDRPAAEQAHAAGVGASLTLAIGGTLDPQRFPPIEVEAEVVRLGDGRWRHQVSGLPADAGRTALLRVGTITLIVVSNAVHMMDQEIFLAHGCDPESFDLIVVKSPGAYARFFTFAEQNYVLDIPGATTANLKLLGHTVCGRPIYPLDDGVTFEPAAEVYRG